MKTNPVAPVAPSTAIFIVREEALGNESVLSSWRFHTASAEKAETMPKYHSRPRMWLQHTLQGKKRSGVQEAIMIRKKPAAINRTCQACKLSKVKCDLTSSGENKCSRCERLNLQCVRVRRGNDGSARLSAPGVCALREESESSLGVLAPTCPSAIEIKMLKNLIILAQSDSSSKQVLRALLRWGSQVAWYRDDTELMAWILGKASAANCGLSLSDFAPTSTTLNAPGTPPSFVREVL